MQSIWWKIVWLCWEKMGKKLVCVVIVSRNCLNWYDKTDRGSIYPVLLRIIYTGSNNFFFTNCANRQSFCRMKWKKSITTTIDGFYSLIFFFSRFPLSSFSSLQPEAYFFLIWCGFYIFFFGRKHERFCTFVWISITNCILYTVHC